MYTHMCIYTYIYTRIFGRATRALDSPLPFIDLRFFTAKAFFNISTALTKSSLKLSCIPHLASRATFNGSLPVASNTKARGNAACYKGKNHN